VDGANFGTLRADYHLKGGTVGASVAINNGQSKNGNNQLNNYVPSTDYDAEPRVGAVDIGADEVVVAAPGMAVTPAALNFGVVSVNASKTLSVTVSNGSTASANLLLANPTMGGSNRFTVANVNCPIAGTGLVPGASCTLNVTYAPNAVALLQTATLNVNAANAPTVTVALSGTAFIPTYSIAPGLAGWNFGNQLVNTASAPHQFTLTNAAGSAGNLVMNGAPTTSGGSANNQFAAAYLAGDTCTASISLAPGASCTFSVVFTPTGAGSKGTSAFFPGSRVGVSVVSGLNQNLLGSPVWGTGGTATARSVTPATLANFANTARGSTSAAQTVTMTNTGFTPVAVTSIGFTGANASYWSQTNSCGSSIAVNSSCTISVRFTPPAAPTGTTGAHNAVLSIVDGLGTTTRAVNGTAL
jgi:hypothetical protein